MPISLNRSVPVPARVSQAGQPCTDQAIYRMMPTSRLQRALAIILTKTGWMSQQEPVGVVHAVELLETALDCADRRVLITAELINREEDAFSDELRDDEIEAAIMRAG